MAFRYRLFDTDGGQLGEAAYADYINAGEEIHLGRAERWRVVKVVPIDEDDDSPYTALLQIEPVAVVEREVGVGDDRARRRLRGMDEKIDALIQEVRREVQAEADELSLAPNGFQAATIERLLARLVIATEDLDQTIQAEGTATRSQLQS